MLAPQVYPLMMASSCSSSCLGPLYGISFNPIGGYNLPDTNYWFTFVRRDNNSVITSINEDAVIFTRVSDSHEIINVYRMHGSIETSFFEILCAEPGGERNRFRSIIGKLNAINQCIEGDSTLASGAAIAKVGLENHFSGSG